MGGNRNIKKEDATNDFSKRKQDINRTGANRKHYASIVKEFRDAGLPKITKPEYLEMLDVIFQLTEDEITVMKEDKKAPQSIRLLLKDLSDSTIRAKMWQDYRDYLFGKAGTTDEKGNIIPDKQIFLIPTTPRIPDDKDSAPTD